MNTEHVDARLKELTCHLRYVNSFLRYKDQHYVDYFISQTECFKQYQPSTRLHKCKLLLHKLVRFMLSNSSFMLSYKMILFRKYNMIKNEHVKIYGFDSLPVFEVYFFNELRINYSEYRTLFSFT